MAENPEPGQELQDPPSEPKAILVAVDGGSANATRVVSMASRLAKSMPGAVIHVVHVFRTSRLNRPGVMGTPQSNADQIEDAKEQLAYHVRNIHKWTRAQTNSHFLMGDPTGEILRLSKELDVDLLVIGTHDYVGFERFLMGSVAETLMRKAGCPVLIVRPKAH
jgi:nucleotide-binding universal stress UspA family protein